MSKSKRIFIITRREFILNKGVGSELLDHNKIVVSTSDVFFSFWVETLLNNAVLKEIINNIKQKSKINNDEKKLDVLFDNSEFKENYLTCFVLASKRVPKNIQDVYNCEYYGTDKSVNVLPACFEILLEYYNKIYPFEKENVLNIVNPKDGIYVYHHWLDKQSINYKNRKNFLPSLRKAVIDNVENKENDKIEVNWLIHDTDLGVSGGDGLLYFNKEKINDDFFDRSNELTELVQNELKEDNIWIFTHTKGINGYYDKIILKPESYNNADELFLHLAFDEDRLKYYKNLYERLNLFEMVEFKYNDVIYRDFIDIYNRCVKLNFIKGNIINENTTKEVFWNIVKIL